MDNLVLNYIKARAKDGLAVDRKGLAFRHAIRSARGLRGNYKQICPYLRSCRGGTRLAHSSKISVSTVRSWHPDEPSDRWRRGEIKIVAGCSLSSQLGFFDPQQLEQLPRPPAFVQPGRQLVSLCAAKTPISSADCL
jgi:hypothetical protein